MLCYVNWMKYAQIITLVLAHNHNKFLGSLINKKIVKLDHIVGCPAERRERLRPFALNSSFCKAHAFEVLTRTSSYHQIYYLCVLFVTISHQGRFCLQVSYPAILFKMQMGFLNRGSFYHSRPFAGNKQRVHIVSFPGRRTRSCRSAGPTMIILLQNYSKSVSLYRVAQKECNTYNQ